jgi:hypothetical protein
LYIYQIIKNHVEKVADRSIGFSKIDADEDKGAEGSFAGFAIVSTFKKKYN